RGLGDLARVLLDGGTRALPSHRVRFSRVEPKVARDLDELRRLGRRWEPALEAAVNSLDVAIRVELLHRRTVELVESGFLGPLDVLLDSIQPEVQATYERLVEARRDVTS